MNTLPLRVALRPAFSLRPPFGLLPGLLLCGGLAWLAARLGSASWLSALGLGTLTLAILAGMVVGNALPARLRPVTLSGIDFARQRLLRLGIILYGLRLSVQQVAAVGTFGLLIDFLVLGSTFFLACWLGRRVFGLDRETTLLIGAGSSICGAAAVMATAPVARADSNRVAVAVTTVVVYGTLAIFVYPWLCRLLPAGLGAQAFGIYTGSTVHEVAQVVAIGHALGAEVENAAVIAKMMRVMMLAPFLLLLSAWLARRAPATEARAPLAVPWFALLFIVVAGVNSLHLLPAHWMPTLLALDNLLLAMAMAALGLATRFHTLRRAGLRPLLLGGVLFLWLVLGGAAINLLVTALLR